MFGCICLDRMNHRIDTRSRRYMRRQGQQLIPHPEQPQSGRSLWREPRPSFQMLGSLRLKIGVTSEPVPAVVGARIRGKRPPLTNPNAIHFVNALAFGLAMPESQSVLPWSIDEPPPTETTPSIPLGLGLF